MTWEMEMDIQYHKGRDEGRAEGIEQEKRSTALKLVEMRLPIEQIIQITGLSVEEILALKPAEMKV